MAALALVGVVMISCSNDDELLQPTNTGKVITLSTTVNLDNGSGTRSLNPTTGVKTFAVGETMALIYQTTASVSKKVVSHALTDGDLKDGDKSATFTFDLEEAPNKEVAVKYVYPASMADDNGINYAPLYTQDGTSGALASNFDLAYNSGAWVSGNLPGLTLQNQLAILAITLKDESGSDDITNTITKMALNNGTNTYTVNRTAADGPIYVAIIPGTYPTITITATDGSKNYMKILSSKTYNTNNVYPVIWKMPVAPIINGKFTINAGGDQVQFAKGNLRYVSGTWSFFDTQDGRYGTYSADAWDKFGWVGTTGTLTSGAEQWGASTSNTRTGYGASTSDKLKSDWGNVPGIGSGWRTLSGGDSGEWNYLFNTRSASTVNGTANARFAKGKVNGRYGVILFPDTYSHPEGVTPPVGINDTGDTGWNGNSYDVTAWAKMEAAGCVFLPTAGSRIRDGVSYVDRGYYWSSTAYYNNEEFAYDVYFGSDFLYAGDQNGRWWGESVRLVREVE